MFSDMVTSGHFPQKLELMMNKAKPYALVKIWNNNIDMPQVLEYCYSIKEARDLMKKEPKDVGQYRGESFKYDVYTWFS